MSQEKCQFEFRELSPEEIRARYLERQQLERNEDGPMYYDPFKLPRPATVCSRTRFSKPLNVSSGQTLLMKDGKATVIDDAGNIIDSAETYVEYESNA